MSRLICLVLLGLIGVMVAGCNLFQSAEPAVPSMPGIVFVTATPHSGIVLNEGGNSLAFPTPQPPVVSTPRPYFAGANELGKVLVLEYHRIGYPELRYQRTPENLRADLERLHASGYYPVNFIDIVHGLPEVPPGKKPIVLTFDDSDISQFNVLGDHTIDADSALGIILNFHSLHPQEWPTRATFFVLGNDTNDYYSVFGQSEWAKAKVQLLIDLGMEVGSHTVSHADLSVATAERIYWELAVSQHVIQEMAPGYKVQSLSVPFGGFPFTLEFLKAGEWGGYSYSYAANAAAWGGPNISPFDPTFEPYHIARLEITDTSLDYWLTYFDINPQEYYVSDGDPSRVTQPHQVEAAVVKPAAQP